MRLRVGEIPYANLFPLFHILKSRFDCSAYEFVSGIPSELNLMLRDGRLDASPSSSVEYLFHRDRYDYLPGYSVSSEGPVRSILLFSRAPLEDLHGRRIALTGESATSVLLLRVLLEHFEGISPVYEEAEADPSDASDRDAFLLIGDRALRAAIERRPQWRIYDLGALWRSRTGLPFVYALWTFRRDLGPEGTALVRALASQIRQARLMARFEYPAIAREAPQRTWLGERGLVGYWENLSFDLTSRHEQAMETFRELALRLPGVAEEG